MFKRFNFLVQSQATDEYIGLVAPPATLLANFTSWFTLTTVATCSSSNMAWKAWKLEMRGIVLLTEYCCIFEIHPLWWLHFVRMLQIRQMTRGDY